MSTISPPRSAEQLPVIEDFLHAIDVAWQPPEPAPIVLKLIGSTALMLQTDYLRGTKDSDVLETSELPTAARKRLLDLAGPGTALHRAHRMYVEIVGRALPFLPQTPVWHRVAELDSLVSIRIDVLDVVDVVVSKLVRFHANDIRDVEAMVARELVPPGRFVDRFRAAMDYLLGDAREGNLRTYVRNLHRVERDLLGVEETEIELPARID
jgi:hypothetical protein